MKTTFNLGLVAWDLLSDDFEHSQLANNWVKIDQHNHEGELPGATFEGTEGGGTLISGTFKQLGRGIALNSACIPPVIIKRYHLVERAVGHRQLGVKQVWSENINKEAVETEHIKNEAVTDPKIAEHTITVDKLDPGVIPLGAVVAWYSSGKGAPPGKVWHVCDGTSWSNIKPNRMGSAESELTAGTIPDLREKFVKGSSLENIGVVGGNPTINLAHTHGVAPHSHTVNAHEHGIFAHTHPIGVGGTHFHFFSGGHTLHTRMNVTNIIGAGTSFNTTAGNKAANKQSVYASEVNEGVEGDQEVSMDFSGAHSHGGATGEGGGANTTAVAPGTSATGLTTEVGLAEYSTIPPFYDLAYIMRVY